MCDNTWPEQEIIEKWKEQYGICIPFEAQLYLQEILTKRRVQLDQQKKVIEAAKKKFEESEAPFYEGMRILNNLEKVETT